jgi:hypothetical protein
MNRSIKGVWIVVILMAGPSLVSADIVEFPLDCAGVYDFNTAPWSTDFDLGVSFTEISHVYIDWAGDITAGLAVQGGSDPFAMVVGIKAYLNPPIDAATTVWGGEATYPDPEAFDSQSEFALSYGVQTWSGLLDGQGVAQIYYTEAIILDGMYVEHGSVDLTSATLVVDGTVVPEPATVLLLAIGAVWVQLSCGPKARQRRSKGELG